MSEIFFKLESKKVSSEEEHVGSICMDISTKAKEMQSNIEVIS